MLFMFMFKFSYHRFKKLLNIYLLFSHCFFFFLLRKLHEIKYLCSLGVHLLLLLIYHLKS